MISEETLQNMLKHGGSFVKKLAELYYVADPENKRKLEEVFGYYFKKYEKW